MVRVRRFVDPVHRPPRIFAGRAAGVCPTAPARGVTKKYQGGPGPPRGPTGGWRTELPPSGICVHLQIIVWFRFNRLVDMCPLADY